MSARTTYTRNYARRQRAAAWLAEAQHATRCPKRVGPGVCGGPLETIVDRTLGRTVLVCPWCERKARGVCRDCGSAVAGRVGYALRCALHKQTAQAAHLRKYTANHRDEVNARARASYADEVVRTRRNEYKRAWRKANPEKVKRQKRREGLRQPKRVRTYQARYRAKHREHYRLEARARYYAEHPTRPAPTCRDCGAAIPYTPPGRPPVRCDAHCTPAQLARRQAKAAAPVTVAPPAVPKKVRRPKGVAVRVESGARRCPVAGCASVLTGRAKKCEPCKAIEREAAQRVIEQRRAGQRRAA